MGEPIYGVEVTYQSGKVSVLSVYLEKDYVDTFFNMASALVGRTDKVDGVASVRLVKCNPVWEECVEDVKTNDLSDLAGLWASEDPHFDVVVPLLLSVDGGVSETPEAEADDTCRRCKGTKCEPSPTGVPMIGAPRCMRCGGSGKQPKFSDLAATVRRHPANSDRPKVKDSCKNLVDHMQHKCVCYKVVL